jgi:hypothetical protein
VKVYGVRLRNLVELLSMGQNGCLPLVGGVSIGFG